MALADVFHAEQFLRADLGVLMWRFLEEHFVCAELDVLLRTFFLDVFR